MSDECGGCGDCKCGSKQSDDTKTTITLEKDDSCIIFRPNGDADGSFYLEFVVPSGELEKDQPSTSSLLCAILASRVADSEEFCAEQLQWADQFRRMFSCDKEQLH